MLTPCFAATSLSMNLFGTLTASGGTPLEMSICLSAMNPIELMSTYAYGERLTPSKPSSDHAEETGIHLLHRLLPQRLCLLRLLRLLRRLLRLRRRRCSLLGCALLRLLGRLRLVVHAVLLAEITRAHPRLPEISASAPSSTLSCRCRCFEIAAASALAASSLEAAAAFASSSSFSLAAISSA